MVIYWCKYMLSREEKLYYEQIIKLLKQINDELKKGNNKTLLTENDDFIEII